MDFINSSRNVYEHLADDISRQIFTYRVMYSMTGDPQYIRHLVEKEIEQGKWFSNILAAGKETYIFGAGIWGREITRIWGRYITAFLDNDSSKTGRMLEGIPIIKPESIVDKSNPFQVIVGTRLYYKEICEQLRKLGVNENEIINVGALLDELSEKQYFDLDYLERVQEETFVDVGSLDGMSTQRFFYWAKNDMARAVCFEPDLKNLPKCERVLKDFCSDGLVEIIPKGAWSEEKTMRFSSKGNGGSTVSDDFMGEDEITEIEVTTLDNILRERNVTFIKMDIEGAEYEALKGCEKIIRRKKPKLAICVYHKPEDIVDLSKLIIDYNPHYKLYLRHYSIAAAETVLYAIPKVEKRDN